MPSSEWEACADAWGVDLPATMPLVTTPLVPMSIPFLALPRELRDMIYRHLLSTKYTKSGYIEPEIVRLAHFLRGPILI